MSGDKHVLFKCSSVPVIMISETSHLNALISSKTEKGKMPEHQLNYLIFRNKDISWLLKIYCTGVAFDTLKTTIFSDPWLPTFLITTQVCILMCTTSNKIYKQGSQRLKDMSIF